MTRKTSVVQLISAGLVILLLSIWLHRVVGNNVFSFAPAPLVLSVIITYSAKHRIKFLVALALISEMYTSFPPGIMTLTVFTPWLINKLTRKISPDLSFFFIGIVAFMVTMQLLIAFSYEIILLLIQGHLTLDRITDVIPYTAFMMIIGVSTLTAATLCIAWRELFPHRDRYNVISR